MSALEELVEDVEDLAGGGTWKTWWKTWRAERSTYRNAPNWLSIMVFGAQAPTVNDAVQRLSAHNWLSIMLFGHDIACQYGHDMSNHENTDRYGCDETQPLNPDGHLLDGMRGG